MSSHNWRHRGGGSPLRSRKNLTSPLNVPATTTTTKTTAPMVATEDDETWPTSPGERGGGGVNTPVTVTPESSESPFDESKPISPKTSAKNARNFWQQKASKSWKPPNKSPTRSPNRSPNTDRGNGNGNNGGNGAPSNGNGNGSVTGSATGSVSVSAAGSASNIGGNGGVNGSASASAASSPSVRSNISSNSHRGGPGSVSGSVSGSSCTGSNIHMIKSALFSGNTKVIREPKNIRKNLSPPVLVEEDDQDQDQDKDQENRRYQSQGRAHVEKDSQDRNHQNNKNYNTNGSGHWQSSGNGNSNGNGNGKPKSNRSWIKNLNDNRNRDRFVKQNPNEDESSSRGSTPSNSPSQTQARKQVQTQAQHQAHKNAREDLQQPQQQTQQHRTEPATVETQSSPKESPRRQRPSRYQQRHHQLQQHHQNYEQQQNHYQKHNSKPPPSSDSGKVQDDGVFGEMQIKLDIAAAKLLTEEMKQKDLAEQLEAAKSKHDQEVEAMLQEITSLRAKQDEQNGKMKKQKEEVTELYVEIERLHESHRAERNLVGNQNSDLEQERNEALQRAQALERELEETRKSADAAEAEAAAAKAEASALSNQGPSQREGELEQQLQKKTDELKHTEKELRAVKKDIDGITNDFRELADETERLEIELEAVTEDRDELLRRSVLYQNQAQSQAAAANGNAHANTSVTIDGDGNEVVVPSSLNESSRREFEMQQQQAELIRLRKSLDAAKESCRKKDEKIQKLEDSKSTLGLDLDLSAIEFENMSYFTEDNKQEIFERFEEHIKTYQGENTRLNGELSNTKQALLSMEKERDNLKVCLADAMQELEEFENSRSPSCSPSPSTRKTISPSTSPSADRSDGEINDVFTQELIQIIREKDTEIEKLTAEITKHHLRTDVSCESFQEDLNNVVEWLNSSTRINGSPSIEIMIRDKANNVTLEPEDEDVVQAIHNAIKTRHYNFLLSNAKLKNAKKELQRQSNANNFETFSEASFERRSSDENKIDLRSIEVLAKREADEAVKELRVHVKACRDEGNLKEKSNKEIRKSLNDAADLIKPLKEHVAKIEHERAKLEQQLSVANRRVEELRRDSEQNRNGASTKPTEDQFGKTVQISPFDLRKKDEEIMDLKIEVNQIRGELKEAKADLTTAHRINQNRSFDEMPTPTKSNRSQLRSISAHQHTSHASNGDDDNKISQMESEIERLNRDLKKKISAEETLKVILRDSSSRLNMMSTQAETLANEKSDAEYRILVLEKENVKLETQLKSVERQSKSSHKGDQSTEDVEDYKHKLDEARHRVDRVSIEAAELKAELKKNSKERKKMKKHLEDAVGMLNSLRSHVESSEKERKKLKKHLRTLYEQEDISFKSDDLPSVDDVAHVPDPDHMENTTTILHLRSHIVKLQHEIRNLEDRIGELEASKPAAIDSADDPAAESKKIQDLGDKLSELEDAHQNTKDLLNEVSEINKEMLNDLKQTETEAAETLEELDILKRKFTLARDEIDNAKYIAASAIRKLNNTNDRSMMKGMTNGGNVNGKSIAYGNLENVALTDCINQLEMRVYAILEASGNVMDVNMNRTKTKSKITPPSSSSNAAQDFWGK